MMSRRKFADFKLRKICCCRDGSPCHVEPFGHDIVKFANGEGLCQVIVSACSQANLAIAEHGVRSHGNDGDPCTSSCGQSANELDAVKPALAFERPVHQDYICL